MIIFFCYILSDLIKKKLVSATVVYSTLMTIYLHGSILCSNVLYYNHSSMRKVHLFRGHVAYVYWIDTAYVQNNLTEFVKGQFP